MDSTSIDLWLKILKWSAERVMNQLNGSLTENFYSRALSLELEGHGCTCCLEYPIPVRYNIADKNVPTSENTSHFIGTCRADISLELPSTGHRVLIEVKHGQSSTAAIRQAENQVCTYNTLLERNNSKTAELLFVVFFPKDCRHQIEISMLDKNGTSLEKLSILS